MDNREEERERTLFVRNIHEDVTEELLEELFLQVCVLSLYLGNLT